MSATERPLGGQSPALAGRPLGAVPRVDDAVVTNFPIGSYSWQPPQSGRWKFVAWSQGGGGTATIPAVGASGAYGEITKYLTPSQRVGVSVAGDTTLTFPDGSVATLTGAVGTTPGGASGFDYQLNGSPGGADGQGTGGGMSGGNGGGAPARLPYRGGGSTSANGGTPGAGGGSSPTTSFGGQGLVLASLVRE